MARCFLVKVVETANEAAVEKGRDLARRVRGVLEKYPDADPDNVRHTLILLDMPPEERLARSLLRGGARTIKQ
jgi:hypothetical protein